jgi:hypothetical protein
MKSVNRIYANTVNTLRNCHRRPNRGVQSRITILALCTALLLPGIVMAKKPQSSPTPGCVILMDEVIYTANSYAVKVVRDPSYPGAWRNPKFTIEPSYPGSTQAVSVEIQPSLANVFSVTYVNAILVVPSDADFGSTATVTATVEEPLKKRDTYRTTTCSATAQIQ